MSSLNIYRVKGACMKQTSEVEGKPFTSSLYLYLHLRYKGVVAPSPPPFSLLTSSVFSICLTSAFALASFFYFSMAWSIKTVCMYRQQNTNRPPESIQLVIFSMCVFCKCTVYRGSTQKGCVSIHRILQRLRHKTERSITVQSQTEHKKFAKYLAVVNA